MAKENHDLELLNEKPSAARAPAIPEEDVKQGTIVVIDEEEKAILRKIDLQ
jgi:hypothetical protein